MKISIVVFGRENSMYTKMVVYHLRNSKLPFDLILEKNANFRVSKPKGFFSKMRDLLSSGAFKPLSPCHWFTWYLLIERFIHRRNSVSIELENKYRSTVLQTKNIVTCINSEEVHSILQKNNYDYALFADVGIVKQSVIEKIKFFCLNAHPAPLPECRGGGALECTLFNNLHPSVSVHIATKGIDEGDILLVKQLQLSENDNFVTITNKLSELCATSLVEVISNISNNIVFKYERNTGKLNYWRDWSFDKQLKARTNLKRILKNVKN